MLYIILKIECEIIIRQKANENERSKKRQSNKKKILSDSVSQVRKKIYKLIMSKLLCLYFQQNEIRDNSDGAIKNYEK